MPRQRGAFTACHLHSIAACGWFCAAGARMGQGAGMREAEALPSEIRGATFSVRQALDAGVPVQRLRRKDLAAPFRGVRAAACADASLLARCAAYAVVMRPGTFFSHTTAAAIYDLPLPRRLPADGRLHVSAVLPDRAPEGSSVRGHTQAERPVLRIVRGLCVPDPVEVWRQLAALLSVDELVIVGDALLRRTAPLCAIDELSSGVAVATGRPGVRRLRAAMESVRARTDSPMETVLRLAIVRAGLPEPQINFRLHGRDGRVVASGDLVFPHARLVVEYDGDHHRTDARQYRIDIDRIHAIQSLGWHVIRVTNAHMAHGAAEAVRRIRDHLER